MADVQVALGGTLGDFWLRLAVRSGYAQLSRMGERLEIMRCYSPKLQIRLVPKQTKTEQEATVNRCLTKGVQKAICLCVRHHCYLKITVVLSAILCAILFQTNLPWDVYSCLLWSAPWYEMFPTRATIMEMGCNYTYQLLHIITFFFDWVVALWDASILFSTSSLSSSRETSIAKILLLFNIQMAVLNG